ncbi:UTP--glucose-1-phosphate uridylyltransferase [Allorhodopirellula heiligendammensis]|uniref:Uridylyltransferase n=1 Tax=Allorhodopirellula heiligendammensis TaxID=2714739 RepID=A0A5C6BYI5_9BACT|nr:UDPGP type 1 family protein [Allorhodopirellula heiligendammensis]TWU16747.1 putative uridylyltransferase [Allorhodopirellula heiligendammensis]
MTTTRDELTAIVAPYDQTHVLQYWDELDASSRDQLAAQIRAVDLAELARLVGGDDQPTDYAEMARRATLPLAVSADGSGVPWSPAEARQRGEEALRAGEIAVILVAGGQGTRLGFDLPKGMFPIGPLSDRTLFQIFADRLIATGRRYDVAIPWYLMTSEATDAPTRAYFEEHGNFGLAADQVVIFKQGTMPAVDAQTGKLLLAEKDSLALSPDGHGGTLTALDRNGCLDRMQANGHRHLFYFQVDNPLVTLCDPEFIGHHLLSESEMTSQVIRKRYPSEKVGNVVEVDGRTHVIEYSDLPDQAAEMTDENGGLKLWAGSIAVHLFDVAFLDRERGSDSSLPFHRASKKVSYLNEAAQAVQPETPNATKFEKFIFDLLPAAERTIICEVEPGKAFAPVKNADGAEADTPALARQAIVDLHRSWLAQAGAAVDDGVKVEINANFALDPDELRARIAPELHVAADQYFDA